jgi:hypothetical protein
VFLIFLILLFVFPASASPAQLCDDGRYVNAHFTCADEGGNDGRAHFVGEHPHGVGCGKHDRLDGIGQRGSRDAPRLSDLLCEVGPYRAESGDEGLGLRP